MREAGRDPAAFTPLAAGPGTWHVLLAPRADAKLASGDPDGVRGQVARLKTALQSLTGVTVVADAASGHAAWLALHEMGSGNDRLVTVGLPLAAPQAPPAPAGATAEMLRRLGEFLPDPDPAEPDDADLATARRAPVDAAGRGGARPRRPGVARRGGRGPSARTSRCISSTASSTAPRCAGR